MRQFRQSGSVEGVPRQGASLLRLCLCMALLGGVPLTTAPEPAPTRLPAHRDRFGEGSPYSPPASSSAPVYAACLI
jgi:hypothetical protein